MRATLTYWGMYKMKALCKVKANFNLNLVELLLIGDWPALEKDLPKKSLVFPILGGSLCSFSIGKIYVEVIKLTQSLQN